MCLSRIITILLPQFRNERQIYPEIPGENVSYPGKKIPRSGPTRNKIPRPGPTRNKIPRPDPTRKYSLKCSPTPDRFRSGPVRSGETRGFGLPRRSLMLTTDSIYTNAKFIVICKHRTLKDGRWRLSSIQKTQKAPLLSSSLLLFYL